jgi:hypothetical protein
MADTITDTPVLERRRLILCFDGTGNFFQGTNSDTNIVKLYKRLERHTPGQFHYYQRMYEYIRAIKGFKYADNGCSGNWNVC